MRSFYVLLFIGVIFIVAIETGRQFKMSDMENHAQFVEHFYSTLSIGHLASVKVHDSMACIFECLRNGLCYSVNFAVESDHQGYLCELLPADIINSLRNLSEVIRIAITVLR